MLTRRWRLLSMTFLPMMDSVPYYALKHTKQSSELMCGIAAMRFYWNNRLDCRPPARCYGATARKLAMTSR